MTPFGYKLLNASEGEKGATSSFKPNAWLEITPDNRITITVGQSELGQGTHTAFAMIIADELEADWKHIRVFHGGARKEFHNPYFPMQLTGGSLSVRSFYAPLRKLGAAGRAMLANAAAVTWDVPQKECEAYNGTVRHKKSGRVLTYGQLCLKAAKLPTPKDPILKKKSQFRYMGTSMPRLDIPDKVRGATVYGMDFTVPDMVIAVLARPPVYGAKPASYDQKAAEKVKGVRNIVPTPRGIAVCAETLDAAWKGRDALNVKWGPGSHPELNNDTIEKLFVDHLDKVGAVARKEGNVKEAMDRAEKKIEATYFCPYIAHATLEPMNCTAHVQKDRCDVWVPTQFQTVSQLVASQISGLPPNKVEIHTLYSGGGFGRRFGMGFVVEAVVTSKAVGKPVKVIWTREEDMQNDLYRPANAHRIEAGIDMSGRLIGWSHKVVCPSIVPSQVKDGLDPYALGGIWAPNPGGDNTAYKIPNLQFEWVPMDLPVPIGYWRSVQNGPNAFAMESFMDEMAHAAGKDPLEFRLQLLKHNKRSRLVLETVAEKAGWGKPAPAGQGRGIAHHFCFGSSAAHIADVSVNKKDGTIKVHRIVAAIDCGPAVAPNNIKHQIAGAITLALSSALKEEIMFSNGGVESENFEDYETIRMSEIPDIEVHIVDSGGGIGGIGEPGVPPTAPAVANAVFDATGVRLRRLPMTPSMVLEALKIKSG
jgi:isoquinoline 1-oxidoreductase beta subunit